ncbi:MAG: redoxin domain-containing protein [Daejeonella sp.]
MKKITRYIAMALLCLKFRTNLYTSFIAFSLLTLITVLSANRAQGQEPKQAGGITIGQQVPDFTLNNIINYKTTSADLSDFKGKLLVLAFWSTTCRSTRESMQQMNDMQLAFKDKIQVIAVSDDSPQMIEQAFARDPGLASTTVPIVIGDTALKSMFPNLILPHLTWVYNGKVKAITSIQYLNKDNIISAQKNDHLNWPVKSDVTGFDYKKPFLTGIYSQPNSTKPVYYSQLSPYLPGVAPGYGVEVDSLNKTVRTWIVNFPAYKICLMAFGRFLGLPANQMLWEVQDKSKYVYDEKEQYKDVWNRANSYCYESILPIDISTAERMNRVRLDLNNFLNLNGRLEKRNVDALVLEFSRDKLPISVGGKPKQTLHRSDTTKVLRNSSLSNISWEMNNFVQNPPVLFDKSINPRVDLDLPVESMTDVESIRNALAPYGITLKSAKRDVEFFVLTENFKTQTKN